MEQGSITLGKTKRVERLRLYRLYRASFPRCERKPFAMIRHLCKAGKAEMLSVRDAGGFCGLVITMLYHDLVLVDYFAIAERQRGRGRGSAALKCIAERYAGRRVFLEIERPDAAAENNAERLRRKDFYLRNGLREVGVAVRLFGVEMELLTFSQKIDFAEYYALYCEIASKPLADKNVILLAD